MIRRIVFMFCLLIVFAFTACTEGTSVAITNRSNVNMRSKPNAKSSLVMQIKTKGTKVTVQDTVQDDQGTTWVLVKTQRGKRGYINGSYLTPAGEVITQSGQSTGQGTAQSTWQDVYGSFILGEEYKRWHGATKDESFVLSGGDNILFGLYDMDRDGIPELIATNGEESMAGKTNFVFTSFNGQIQYLGTVGFRECILTAINHPVYSGLFCEDGNMGVYETCYYHLYNGEIVSISVRESDHNGGDGESNWIDNPVPVQLTGDDALYQASFSNEVWILKQYSIVQIRQMGINAFYSSTFLEPANSSL